MTPWFLAIGWLQPNEPFRKITFLIALGMIMGAAVVDMSLILFRACSARGRSRSQTVEQEDWKQTNTRRSSPGWCSGASLVIVGSQVLHQPLGYVVIAVVLVFVFVMVNGIIARHHRLEPHLLRLRASPWS